MRLTCHATVFPFQVAKYCARSGQPGFTIHPSHLAWALIAIGILSLSAPVSAQDKSDLPWYDAESRQVRPLGIKLREDVTDPERNQVAPFKPKSTNSTTTTTNPLFGAGGGAGANGGAALGSILSILMWGVAGIVAIALLAALIYYFVKAPARQEEEELIPQRTMAESIEQLPFDIEVNQKGDFRSMAYQFYQQGDLRRATILLFSHVLVSLDQKGFIRLKKGKTNRQYLRELSPYQQLGRYYGQVMVRFEEAFFGDREIRQPDFESCWNGLEAFQAGIEKTQINTEIAT